MAEEQDDAQKTEEPTHKKLEEAHKKGDVARSQELKHWFMLVAGAIALAVSGSYAAGQINDILARYLAAIHTLPTDGAAMADGVFALINQIAVALALPLTIVVIGALAGSMVQHKPLFTFEKVKPKWSKISPLAGLKRMFSANNFNEFGKTVAKFAIVAVMTFLIVMPERDRLETVVTMPTADMVSLVATLAFRVMAGVIAVMTAVAFLDVLFQRYQHTKKLRMTKQEVKDEFKQLEGDPQVKARLRQIRMEKARQRMMAAVPEADVVVTNPTHYAVALKYEHGTMEVPVLLAKGTDAVAQRIRALAEEHAIPLVENPPLARTLFATVDIDEEIPPEHYQAVAEVIGYVMRLRRSGITSPSSPGPRRNGG